MTNQQLETKERILLAAQTLFSKNGFNGTSVREIAKESGVNLAAVNYHFKTKEALFYEVFLHAHIWMETQVETVSKDASSLADFVSKIFLVLIEDRSYIRNIVRLMMTENINPPDPKDGEYFQKLTAGPPGEVFISQLIEAEVNRKLTPEESIWGTMNILGALMHWAMMVSSSKMTILCEAREEFSDESITMSLAHLSSAVVDYIRSEKLPKMAPPN